MKNDYGTILIRICLDIANIADEKGEKGERVLEELGFGYRALSGILRRGCKEIIDLQNSYHAAIAARQLAEIGKKSVVDFMEEVFGDREIHCINDKDKERIKAFVKQIEAEWDAEEGDD